MKTLMFEPKSVVTPNKGGQEGFATDWESYIVAAEGGWYSGKTFIGARKLLTLHEYNAFDADGEPTYVLSFIVAPTYGNARDFCVPHFEDACDEAGLSYIWHGQNCSLPGGRYSGPAITLPDFGTKQNPSVILIRSAEIPKRITGFTAGAAWGDEPARWKEDKLDPLNDSFLQMTGRVRSIKARLLQILLTYTNEGDVTRVYEEMHAGHKNRKLYRIPTLENPTAKQFYDEKKGSLTAELAEQYLGGKAAQLRGGKVYTSFDFNSNVDNKLTLRKGLPLQISLDFNIVPGMHLEVGQYHPDLDLFTVIYEIHAARMSVQRMADEFVLLTKKINWNWETSGKLEVFGDATGRSEWAGIGESCYWILQQKLVEQNIPYWVRVPRSNPPVADRINAFNVALHDMSGKIHWRCHPRCERLIDDLRKMQRDKKGEIETTDRKLSHACLAKETLVETENGEIPIENIRIGMKVLTHNGYQRVLWSGLTGKKMKVFSLQMSNGRILYGTGEHLIFQKSGCLCRLDSLQYDTVLYSVTENQIWRQKQLPLMAKNTAGGLIRAAMPVFISGHTKIKKFYICIVRYGNIISAQFQRVIKSITKTVIHLIIALTTWNVFQPSTIFGATVSTPNILERSDFPYRTDVNGRMNGINQKKANNGIVNKLKGLISGIIQKRHTVKTAVVSSVIYKAEKQTYIAQELVKQQHEENPVSMAKFANVLSVKQNSQSINTGQLSAVPVLVQHISRHAQRKDVYDLTIENFHEFYANGILVKNSSAEGYRVEYLRPVRAKSDGIGGRVSW